ncbi:MAG TPA: efflux RND transporter permease subunit, partial [Micromonosporaceae bacterium]|nr:efflux RND transporter permease subunit [Micromonosporaceae bacterium]
MTPLARLSLASRSLVIMIALLIAGFGAYAVPKLKQQLFPSFAFPVVTVVSTYQGASPEIVERQVTEPIEHSLQGLDGVEEIISNSSEGLSRVQVAVDYEIELDKIVTDIEQAVDGVETNLPDDVNPTVVAGSTDDIPVMALAVSDGDDQRPLLDKLERTVVPELAGIQGVRDVMITGAREDQVVITPDPKKLARAGLTAAAIPAALQAYGVALPAGSLTRDQQSLTVEVGEQLDSVGDIENLYLTPSVQPLPGGRQAAVQPGRATAKPPAPVKLGDVATVESRPEEATAITRTNGRPSLGLSITMSSDGNAVAISHEVRDRLADLEDTLGGRGDITVVFDQAPAVERAIEDLSIEGLFGLIFAVLTIMIFLLSVRSTLVTAVSIPLSVVVALTALWLGDYSLNILTLGALTISVGRVVDDSIVVLENIKRHLGYGEPKHQAIVDAVREVAGAVTSSTLTTVAVFLPIAFVSGLVGQLFSSFAITVTVALLASLFVSLTVIPVLAYWFLKSPTGSPEQIRERAERRELRSPLQRGYVPVLRFATRFKALTVVIGIAVFIGTVALIPSLKTNFIDSSGQDTTYVSLRMPLGTDLGTTDAAARKVETVLADHAGVDSYQVNIGSGSPLFGGLGGSPNRASFTVAVAEAADTPTVERELRDAVAKLSGVGDVTVGETSGREAMGGNAVEVIVKAADRATLERAASQVEGTMSGIDGLRDVTSSLEDAAPRIEVTVDRKKAAAVGITEVAVGQAVAQAFRGQPIGELTIDGRNSDIVLSGGDKPADLGDIERLTLPTAAGPVRLSSVAKVAEVAGPVQITRIDGERSATVSAAAGLDDLGAVTSALTDALVKLDLPEGASYTIGGASADQREAFGDLGL